MTAVVALLLALFQLPGTAHEDRIQGTLNLVMGINAAPNLTSGSGNFIVGDYLGKDLTTQNCQIRVGKLKITKDYASLSVPMFIIELYNIEDFCHYPHGKLMREFSKVEMR